MKLRSQFVETLGFRPKPLLDQRGRPAGGRWFKLPKLWGGPRGQAVNHASPADGRKASLTDGRKASLTDGRKASLTDGRHSPKEEEPQKVILTFQQILEGNHFREAGQLLMETEEQLFGERIHPEVLQHHQEYVDQLAADYGELRGRVLETLKLSLSPAEVSLDALISAVDAIKQEEDQDQQWKQREQTPPAWRPSGWRKLHDETVRTLVEQRMDDQSAPPADQADLSSIQADIQTMGRRLKEDLLLVAGVVKSCYPSSMDICNFYARLYHQNHSARLEKIAEFVLGDKDSTFLLRWVNEFYPEILQKPELAAEIHSEELGKLLPKDLLEPLEEQYLSKQQDELMVYVSRILEEAEEKWTRGEAPIREDGCFVSPMAYDIIQFINGMVTSAEKVVGDRHKARRITCQLGDLMLRFRTFHTNIMKQDKASAKPFIKANLGCIEQFSDVLRKKRHLSPEDVRENCLHILSDMKESAHSYLLKPVHEVLKPQYRKLGTSDWLNKPLFAKLLVSIEDELQDLQGSPECCHQMLVGRLHLEVTAEYVKRLLKGEIKLKDREQQLKAYVTVKDDADSLQSLFVNMGSKEDWLEEILSKIAELLKLQDLPAIQMQVASLGTAFPDLSVKHVSALLKLKTNLSRADRRTVKETLSETLNQTSLVITRPFFSEVQVK